MVILKSEALLLRRQAYRNTSILADLFTRSHGRLSVIAKGARRPTSDLDGCLDYGQRIEAVWIDRGQGLGILTEAAVTGYLPRLRAGARRMAATLLYLRFLREFLEERQPEPAQFDQAAVWLEGLDRSPAGAARPLFIGGLAGILAQAGFRPDLNACRLCGRKPVRGLVFEPAADRLVCLDCRPGAVKNEKNCVELSPEAIMIVMFLQDATPAVVAGTEPVWRAPGIEAAERFVTTFAGAILHKDLGRLSMGTFHGA
ncbi:MAG: DNA repair protein RecO [Planctomycetota bacterium]